MPSSRSGIRTGPPSRTRRAETTVPATPSADAASPEPGALPWLVPPAYDASAASLAAHVHAIGEVMAGRARLWLGPSDPPAQLPAGFEETALVVPTSGSTGTAKAVALTRQALLASQDATAQLFAADGTAS